MRSFTATLWCVALTLIATLDWQQLRVDATGCASGHTACGDGCYVPCAPVKGNEGFFYYTCTNGKLGNTKTKPASCAGTPATGASTITTKPHTTKPAHTTFKPTTKPSSGSSVITCDALSCRPLSCCATTGYCYNSTITTCPTGAPVSTPAPTTKKGTTPAPTRAGTTAPSTGQVVVTGCPAPAQAHVSNPVGTARCTSLCTEDSVFFNTTGSSFPATTLTLGSKKYNEAELRYIMARGSPQSRLNNYIAPSGDQSTQLAYTLIATLENQAAGTPIDSTIQGAINAAQAYLIAYPINPDNNINPSGCTQKNQEAVAQQLYLYNCGYNSGPGGCPGVSCTANAGGDVHKPAVLPGFSQCTGKA